MLKIPILPVSCSVLPKFFFVFAVFFCHIRSIFQKKSVVALHFTTDSLNGGLF